MNVRRISDSTIKRLFALSGNRCSFPQCTTRIVQESGTITGRICHIRAASPGGPRYDPSQTDADRNSFSNLLLLCSVHHDIVDAEEKKYAAELLAEIKDIHERSGNIELSQQDSFLVRRLIDHCPMINASGEAQVMVASPGAIQAKNVNVKLSKSKGLKIQPVESIGASIEMRAYTTYLISKYIDWRNAGIRSGKDKRRFHPSMLHQWIEKEFGTKTFFIHQSRFEDLGDYLKDLIDGTIFGKSRLRNDQRNYHSFDDHLIKLRGEASD